MEDNSKPYEFHNPENTNGVIPCRRDLIKNMAYGHGLVTEMKGRLLLEMEQALANSPFAEQFYFNSHLAVSPASHAGFLPKDEEEAILGRGTIWTPTEKTERTLRRIIGDVANEQAGGNPGTGGQAAIGSIIRRMGPFFLDFRHNLDSGGKSRQGFHEPDVGPQSAGLTALVEVEHIQGRRAVTFNARRLMTSIGMLGWASPSLIFELDEQGNILNVEHPVSVRR